MKIGIVVFDGFTDLDFYLPWDLLNRVSRLIHKEGKLQKIKNVFL